MSAKTARAGFAVFLTFLVLALYSDLTSVYISRSWRKAQRVLKSASRAPSVQLELIQRQPAADLRRYPAYGVPLDQHVSSAERHEQVITKTVGATRSKKNVGTQEVPQHA